MAVDELRSPGPLPRVQSALVGDGTELAADAPVPAVAPASLASTPRRMRPVLLRCLTTSVCGSDVLFASAPSKGDLESPGFSLHEAIGVVVAGSGEPGEGEVAVGDVVLALPSNYVKRAREVHRELDDEQAAAVSALPWSGAGAEYFTTMARYCWRLPSREERRRQASESGRPAVPLCHFVAAQPLGTVLSAVRKLPNIVGKDVVVLGQGQNGLLFTSVLVGMGARRVIGVDKLESRLVTARRMRATHTVVAVDEEQVRRDVRAVLGGALPHVVVEVVGHQTATLSECVRLARFGGTVLAFGVPADKIYPLDYGTLFRQNVTLIPSVFPDASRDGDFGQAVDWIADGRVDVTPLFTHAISLREVPGAIRAHAAHAGGVVKTLVTVSSGPGEAETEVPELPVLHDVAEGAAGAGHA